jgi:dipeptidase E
MTSPGLAVSSPRRKRNWRATHRPISLGAMSRSGIQPQIVVFGGGGFSMEPRNPRLDRYVLNLTRKRRPRVCFVPTASGDSGDYIRRFYLAFEKHPCRPSDLPLFRRDRRDPAAHLLDQDLIYVGGGNTANLLAVWRLHGVDRAMRQAWQNGAILCGVSAGMNCWFQCSVTDSFGPLAPLRDGLGLLRGSACPHYDGDAHRRPAFHKLIAGGFAEGVAADDGAAIHYVGRRIHKCIASRKGARAYRLCRRGNQAAEMPLKTDWLEFRNIGSISASESQQSRED